MKTLKSTQFLSPHEKGQSMKIYQSMFKMTMQEMFWKKSTKSCSATKPNIKTIETFLCCDNLDSLHKHMNKRGIKLNYIKATCFVFIPKLKKFRFQPSIGIILTIYLYIISYNYFHKTTFFD